MLEVDRIYIRKGAKDFSSITFKVRGKKVERFWVSLNEVNLMQIEPPTVNIVVDDEEEI